MTLMIDKLNPLIITLLICQLDLTILSTVINFTLTETSLHEITSSLTSRVLTFLPIGVLITEALMFEVFIRDPITPFVALLMESLMFAFLAFEFLVTDAGLLLCVIEAIEIAVGGFVMVLAV